MRARMRQIHILAAGVATGVIHTFINEIPKYRDKFADRLSTGSSKLEERNKISRTVRLTLEK